MHLLPQLRETERRFQHELVVIGVHAGKFHAERETANIRQAVLRLEIDHPVVNDRQFRIWRSYGVNAWPTMAFIDPDGHYIGSQAGEVLASDLVRVIGEMVSQYDAQGKINRGPLTLRSEQSLEPDRPLAFPGKILAATQERLFISDSNHHRILAVRLNLEGDHGTVEAVAGRGTPGLADGQLHSAAFYRPQGLALHGDLLYVADTENHAVRLIDWAKGTVTTVAGTGEQDHYRLNSGGRGPQVALNSPWDVLVHEGSVYVVMAGSHQLWRLDFASGQIQLHGGTGREALVDGPLLRAALNQPSGLATDGSRIYFADSEASAIRWADPGPQGKLGTIVGTGLFDFGDVDGAGDAVRLQHPVGLTWHGGKIYVADTYNNKIKVVDPATRSAATFAGTGDTGHQDGDVAAFNEPCGLSATENRLYVADTNNHLIRVIDLATRRVSTLALNGA